MASFVLPEPTATGLSCTLGELYDKIRRAITRDNDAEFGSDGGNGGLWNILQHRQAVQQGLFACAPLGVSAELSATAGQIGASAANTQVWEIPARLIKLGEIWLEGTFNGAEMRQHIPLGSVTQSALPDGTTTLRFKLPVPDGVMLRVSGSWHYPVPDAESGIVAWPWIDLLVAYSCAELYRMALHHGMSSDIQQYMEAERSWREYADGLKMTIALGLGVVQPVEEKPRGGFQKRK